MPRLSDDERRQVLRMIYEDKNSVRKVAAFMKCSPTTVQNLKKKYKKYSLIRDRPRSGRPKKFNEKDGSCISSDKANNSNLAVQETITTPIKEEKS
ncbi:unnamed protein product [Dimorphilus gyrociliatus]|uniref:Uncharacterized protein n=1 Tax=Dimorphilus gyrociliatus TaxID=2664684 RepID=A0A7I8VVH1_9ANNE|nr:unnamed protein product [Dimorphilus gyrociliatus]